MDRMAGNPTSLFGKQVRKRREARHWPLGVLSVKSGIAAGHLSRIENGKRPPTERIAHALDAAFETDDFTDLFREMQTWAPTGFADWPEHENNATSLREWSGNGNIPGLLQTPDYARALLETYPNVSGEIVDARLRNRMARQQRVLHRNDPPQILHIIDHTALYRLVGDPDIMADQMGYLAEVATLPNVVVQILPAVAHPATQSGFLMTDTVAYTEHIVGGLVITDVETVTALAVMFDKLRTECYRARDSTEIIRRAGAVWTGEKAPIAERTVETVSK